MDLTQARFFPLLAAVAPVFLVIGLGYGVRRINWLTEEADASLMRIIVNLLFPCLILDTLLGNRAFDNPANLCLAPLAGFFSVCLGYAASWWAAPRFGITQPELRRTFAFTTGLYNYGYVPLPLVQKFFDSQTTAVLFIHNVGVEIALWTTGILILRGRGLAGPIWRQILNAPLLAIAAALSLHALHASQWLPPFATQSIHNLGAAAIPMGLLLTGATFADQMGLVSPERTWKASTGSIFLRLAVLPVLMLLIARWIPLPAELRRVILVQAAMPCAVIPVLLSRHFGGQPALAMGIVLATSGLGLFTIPFWLQTGAQWIPGISR